MEIQTEKLLENITNFLRDESKTDTVVGKEFKVGGYSCVPVVKIGTGFGTGGRGNKEGSNDIGGAGAGIGIEPIGFLVSKGDDVSFIGTNQAQGLSKVFEKVPGLIEKYMETTRTSKREAKAATA